ncbi:MAG: leucine-rich repeat domain-containing protein [Clostridia bacterium]|nr:leucine-rich repeat domain-containing protein [Clostridia bacterium]
MKQEKVKLAYGIVTALLAVMLCVGLVAVTMTNLARDEVPVMAEGEETEPDAVGTEMETEAEPTEEETEIETEAETEPEPEDLSSKGLVFTSNGNGTCYVSGMGTCRDSFVILPHSSPVGDVVIGIGDYAFRGCTELRSIEINSAIRYIGAYAFYGSGLVSVTLPAEVEAVGDFAFVGCRDLEKILVDAGNEMYCDVDGVLYDKEMKTLITCPMGKRVNSMAISSLVREIKTMAFYKCDTIKAVYYEGGVNAYRKIHMGAGNEPLESAIVYYSSGTPDAPANAEK